MTTWNPNIPNPADVPASDATAMQQNFSVLDTAFAVDHVNLALLTAQGFHKQISITGAGASPYTVAGTQNYEYAKLLGSNTRSYLEYQPSGPDTFSGNPAVVPLSFKAYVVFTVNVGGVGAIKRSFNIASVTAGFPGFTIVFNETMPDAFYTVIATTVSSNIAAYVAVTSQATTQCIVTNNLAYNQYSTISVAVM